MKPFKLFHRRRTAGPKTARRFKDLPFLGKISIVICALTLALSTLILAASVAYYHYILSSRVFERTQEASWNAASTLNVNYKNILDRFTSICGTTEFASDIQVLNSPESSYTVKGRLVQNELSDLTSSNYLIQSALILSGDGRTAYSLYRNPMDASEELFAEGELLDVHGITWLPERRSPLRSYVSVIPLVLPITINSANYAVIDLKGGVPDVYVVLYLDCSKLSESLALSNAGLNEGSYYLFTDKGALLSGFSDEHPEELLNIPAARTLIGALSGDAAPFSEARFSIQTSGRYMAAARLNQSGAGLILLGSVPREPIQDIFGQTGGIVLLILGIVIGLLLVISFLVARYITRPVGRLAAIVRLIQEDRYQTPQDFGTSDEMGQLCTAINQMYATIKRQMERIKKEEAEKYMAEIRLLTEQINPHFLYNTLDCIQSEVRRGENDTAAGMIQYLAEYMRIGLSGGAVRIPLSNEIRHANAYIRLMNQRFGQSILFLYHLPPELSQHMVVKTILQPLVENSIKHGFGIDAPGLPGAVPSIEVTASRQDDELILRVSDNGSGFDPAALKALLSRKDDGSGGHVGLLNVYHRLTACYGEGNVRFSFDSIPYYSNTISICLPFYDGSLEKAT